VQAGSQQGTKCEQLTDSIQEYTDNGMFLRRLINLWKRELAKKIDINIYLLCNTAVSSETDFL